MEPRLAPVDLQGHVVSGPKQACALSPPTGDSPEVHLLLLLLSRFSRVQLCAAPETAAHQALLSSVQSLTPRGEDGAQSPLGTQLLSQPVSLCPRFTCCSRQRCVETLEML